MWSKTAIKLINKVQNPINLRLARQLQSASKGSYRHNPGSEPLTYATLGDVIAETAHKYPGRVAIKSIHENVTVTYEQLLTQIDSLGCALRARGFEKGDRLGIWSHNTSAWIIAVIAAAKVGLIPVLLNPMYEKPELSYCIKKTSLKGLFIGEALPKRNYYEMVTQLIPELQNSKPGSLDSKEFPYLRSVITSGKEKLGGTFTIDSLIANHPNNGDVTKYGSEISPDDGCMIHLTSGTTGNPKAALDSHMGVVNNTYFTGKRNEFHERHQKICVQVPLFHALGSIITILGGMRHGASLILAAPTYNVAANINALVAEQCSVLTGTPTMFVDLLSEIRTKGELPLKLNVALAAGAPCSPQLIKDINKLLNCDSVKALYGMTESTASTFQSLPGDSVELVAETVGYIQDHIEAKVIDEQGKLVPLGSPGELVVRGYNSMIYYWDEPGKTKEALGNDGWLRTGDKFVLTEDGYGKIVGRLKDIIVRGGENIAPKEIEDFLNTHPDIIESQVVGLADERLGEELCVALRLREGTSINLQNVRDFCSGRLAQFKIPRILKVVDEFPKTTSGKIQKFRLKELIESGKI